MKLNSAQKAQFTKALTDLAAIPLEAFTHKLWDDLMKKFSDFTDEIKIYFYYEEKNCPLYTLQEASKWFKDNLRPGRKLKGGIYMERSTSDKPIRLHLFFIENGRALIDERHAHLFVNTLELEPFFSDLFGGKQLIIIE